MLQAVQQGQVVGVPRDQDVQPAHTYMPPGPAPPFSLVVNSYSQTTLSQELVDLKPSHES